MKVLIAALLLSASLAPAQQASKTAKIERLLVITKASAMMDQMFDQMKGMMAQQTPAEMTPEQRASYQKGQAKVMDLVKDTISWDKMRPQYIKLYSETFTEPEIDGMLTFYESPSGKAVLDKMPVLMQKSMTLASAQMQDVVPKIQEIIRDSLKK